MAKVVFSSPWKSSWAVDTRELPLVTHSGSGDLLTAGLALWMQDQLEMVVSGYAFDLVNPITPGPATVHFDLEVMDRQGVKLLWVYFKVFTHASNLVATGVIRGSEKTSASTDFAQRTWVKALLAAVSQDI